MNLMNLTEGQIVKIGEIIQQDISLRLRMVSELSQPLPFSTERVSSTKEVYRAFDGYLGDLLKKLRGIN